MSRPGLPFGEEAAQLPEACRTVAGPEWEDGNGHVNVQYTPAASTSWLPTAR